MSTNIGKYFLRCCILPLFISVVLLSVVGAQDCPPNAHVVRKAVRDDGTVHVKCECNAGYVTVNGECVPEEEARLQVSEKPDSRDLVGRWVDRTTGDHRIYYQLTETGRDSFKVQCSKTVSPPGKIRSPWIGRIEATIKQGGEFFGTVTLFSEQTDVGCTLPRITIPMRGRISPDKNSIEIIVYDFPYADFQSCKWNMNKSKESRVTLYRD